MLWMLMAIAVIAGGMMMMRRRRAYEASEHEPWRASLNEDEPLDLDEIRRAEEDWLEDEGWEDRPEEEAWR